MNSDQENQENKQLPASNATEKPLIEKTEAKKDELTGAQLDEVTGGWHAGYAV